MPTAELLTAIRLRLTLAFLPWNSLKYPVYYKYDKYTFHICHNLEELLVFGSYPEVIVSETTEGTTSDGKSAQVLCVNQPKPLEGYAAGTAWVV